MEKVVTKVAESMASKGLQIQRFTPLEIEVLLTYTELSDFLDMVIYDIAKFSPELFDNSLTTYVAPALLKTYLYVISLYHFKQAGVLSNAGGYTIPDAAGFCVPTPLLAFLQYIGVYAEGDVIGKARYNAPASVAVIGNDGLLSGAPSEANLYLSNAGFTFPGYITNAAQGEKVGHVTGGNAQNINTWWPLSSDSVSDLLSMSNYPCLPMWRTPPRVPDGSFFASASQFDSTISTANTYFVNGFNDWNAEIAALYYTSGTITSSVTGIPTAPRMGVMAVEWPSYPGSGGWDDAYLMRKSEFIFIIRHGSFEPGQSTQSMRQFAGTKLNSFRITPLPVRFDIYWVALAKSILQVCQQTGVYTNDDIYCAQVVHAMALTRRLQVSSPSFFGNLSTIYRALVPKSFDSLPVLVSMAQLINEIGPVVREGYLHCPNYLNPGASSSYWWRGYSATAVPPTTCVDTPIVMSPAAAPTWSVGAGALQTLNAAWVTAYTLLPTFLFVSWIAVQKFAYNMLKLFSAGTAYGKGDLTYPVTKNPWGGVSQFAVCTLATQTLLTVESPYKFYTNTIQAIYSNVPIVGDEIAIVALSGFGYLPGAASARGSCKYGITFDDQIIDPYVERFVSAALTPGGVFLDALSGAMEKRHGHGSGEYGIAGANENLDACLWDAMKKLAGTIAGAIRPIVPEVVGAGCGAIPLVGFVAGELCSNAADALLGYAEDLAKSGTNRHDAKPAKQEVVAIAKDVSVAQRAPMGELPVNRARRAPRAVVQNPVQESLVRMQRKLEELERRSRASAKAKQSGQQKPKGAPVANGPVKRKRRNRKKQPGSTYKAGSNWADLVDKAEKRGKL